MSLESEEKKVGCPQLLHQVVVGQVACRGAFESTVISKKTKQICISVIIAPVRLRCAQQMKCPFVSSRITYDPLDPDDVIASTLGYKVLQAATEVVAHSLAVLSQVRLCFVQELLRHVHQVHRLEERQQQTLGDPADACAAVQSAAGACLAFPFLQR